MRPVFFAFLVASLVFIHSCAEDDTRPTKREIAYYVDRIGEDPTRTAQTETTKAHKDKKDKKEKIISSEDANNLIDKITTTMEKRSLLTSDIGKLGEELANLKKHLKSGELGDIPNRAQILLSELEAIKIDSEFSHSKYERLAQAVKRIQPRGDFLETIVDGMDKSNALISAGKFEAANKLMSELFEMLGEQ